MRIGRQDVFALHLRRRADDADSRVVREGSFAILTTEPGPDVAPIYNRQVVVLPDEQAWLAWSEGAVLPGVLAAGTLNAVAEAVGGFGLFG